MGAVERDETQEAPHRDVASTVLHERQERPRDARGRRNVMERIAVLATKLRQRFSNLTVAIGCHVAASFQRDAVPPSRACCSSRGSMLPPLATTATRRLRKRRSCATAASATAPAGSIATCSSRQ